MYHISERKSIGIISQSLDKSLVTIYGHDRRCPASHMENIYAET